MTESEAMQLAAIEPRLLRKMQTHGSNFTSALATAWLAADPDNRAILRGVFGHILLRYERAPEVPQ